MNANRLALLLVLVMLLNMMFPLHSWAASEPAGDFFVSDEAGMLPPGAAERLSEQSAQSRFRYHIVTVPSLYGDDPSEYGIRLYREKQLQMNDILIVLSQSERSVEMKYNNASLQARINDPSTDTLGRDAIRAFLDRHFIPLAREDRVEEALAALIRETDALMTASGTEAAAPPASSSPEPPASQESRSSASAFAILGVTTGLLVFLFALWYWSAKLRRRQLDAQEVRIAELMAATERCRSALRPFAGFVQGDTEQVVNRIDQALSAQLLDLDALRGSAGDRQPPLLHTRRIDALHDELKARLDQAEDELGQLGEQIAVLTEADKQVRAKTDRLADRLASLQDSLARRQAETGYPLDELERELKRSEAELAAADQLEVFDPIAATKGAVETRSAIERLEQQLGAISHYDSMLEAYPAASASAIREIDQMIAKQGIDKAAGRLRPHDLISQSAEVIAELREQLRHGSMTMVARLGAQVQQLLGDAVDMTARQVDLKQQNARDLDYLQSKGQLLADAAGEVTAGLAALRDNYHDAHWLPLQQQFNATLAEVERILEQLDEARRLSSDEQQDYDLAHELLAGWREKVNAADDTIRDCRNLFWELDQRLERSRQIKRQLEHQLKDIHHFIRSEDLDILPAWDESFGIIRRCYQKASEGLQTPPHQLDDLEAELKQCISEIQSVQRQIDIRVDEKRQAERQLREAQAYYDHLYYHSGRQTSRQHEISSFYAILMQAHQLYTQRKYDEVIAQLRHAERLIGQLQAGH